MNAPIAARVRAAASPQDALIEIALALDDILDQLAIIKDGNAGSPDAWGSWEARAHDTPAMSIMAEGDSVEVVFADPPLAVKTQRADFARDVLHLDEAWPDLPGNEAIEAFMIGGPLWFHAYDRELFLQHPVGVRQAMVADVARFDEKAADELGRDVLKANTDDARAAVMPEWKGTFDD